jgi:hypothetical protein
MVTMTTGHSRLLGEMDLRGGSRTMRFGRSEDGTDSVGDDADHLAEYS